MNSHPTDELVRTMARVRDESLRGYADRPAARNLLNEVTAIAPAPVPSARVASPGRFRVSRTGVRLIAVGALAAAMAIGTAVVQTGGGPDGDRRPAGVPFDIQLGSVAEAAQVLDRAAAAAETRHYTAPRPQQWVYIKWRGTHPKSGPNGGSGVATGGPYVTEEWETWRRADGKQNAAYQPDGKLGLSHETEGRSRSAKFDPLPTDPDALLRKIRKAESGGGDGLVFGTLVTIMGEGVHPPKTEAAILQAMKRISGVTPVKGRVDAGGRPAIALGRTEDGFREEILLDPKTYTYLGSRMVSIEDRKTGQGMVRKGTLQHLTLRVAAAIVDKPGQRA